MTPEEFIAKWRGVELPEVAASHDHFNETQSCSTANSAARSTRVSSGDDHARCL